jgi:hypothetical protein
MNWGFAGFGLAANGVARASRQLDSQSQTLWKNVAFWFVVGICSLQVGGTLAEATASMAAAAVLTSESWYILRGRSRGGQQTRGTLAGRRARLRTH